MKNQHPCSEFGKALCSLRQLDETSRELTNLHDNSLTEKPTTTVQCLNIIEALQIAEEAHFGEFEIITQK